MEGGAVSHEALLAAAARRLAAAGHPQARAAADRLWRSAGDAAAFESLLRRAEHDEPLAYLEGSVGFHEVQLAVDPRVLVPRPDSECVVELGLESLPGRRAARVLDLGTGSGCLLLAILHSAPSATGVGLDRSVGAVRLARDNASRLALDARARFLVGDWLEPLAGRFDLVVANPPYVEPGEELGPGVAEFEPEIALFTPAGQPLAAYTRILSRVARVLPPGGALVFEVGARRAPQVAAACEAAGLAVDTVRRDLGGVARAVRARPG